MMDIQEETTNPFSTESGVRPLEAPRSSFPLASAILFVGVILLGVGTGYLFAHARTSTISVVSQSGSAGTIAKGTVMGSTDLTTFKDTATGTLQQGGIQGEGQYHLVRQGGDSQNVYLTSSIVDLSQFVGKKILVHGQTQKAKYAGWLMDVGQVEVTD